MQFRVTKQYHYTWPVTVRMPSADKAGSFDEMSFKAIFKALPRPRLRELMQTAAAGGSSADVVGDTVREVLVGWDNDVRDSAGKPASFTPGMLEAAMDNPWFAPAVWRAFIASVSSDPASGN